MGKSTSMEDWYKKKAYATIMARQKTGSSEAGMKEQDKAEYFRMTGQRPPRPPRGSRQRGPGPWLKENTNMFFANGRPTTEGYVTMGAVALVAVIAVLAN